MWEPVCGPDMVTYGNSCEAERNGHQEWAAGMCPALAPTTGEAASSEVIGSALIQATSYDGEAAACSAVCTACAAMPPHSRRCAGASAADVVLLHCAAVLLHCAAVLLRCAAVQLHCAVCNALLL